MTLNDFYARLENEWEVAPHIIYPEIDDLSLVDRFKVRLEYFAVNLNKDILSVIPQGMHEKATDYFKLRSSEASNPLLRAKYNEHLYRICKDNCFCRKAVDEYKQALIASFLQKEFENYELNVKTIFEKVVNLSLGIKYEIASLKQQIVNYIGDNSIAERLKTRLFMSLNDVKLFSKNDYLTFPAYFISLAESTTETIWVENNLKIALVYARKLADNEMIMHINELFGDNEMTKIHPADDSNIAIEHMNEAIYEKALSFYTIAKCTTKIENVQRLHAENKTNKKYIPIRIPSKLDGGFYDLLDSQIEVMCSMKTTEILVAFILGQGFLFLPSEKISKLVDDGKDYFYKKYMTPVQADINSNHKQVNESDNDTYYIYHNSMKLNVDFIGKVLCKCIETKKISYAKLRSFLTKNTIMGVAIEERGYSYNLFSLIEQGVESFVKQFSSMLKDRNTDWRISTEVLSIKFEGLLRSILVNEGVNVTKHKNGNTSMYLLEDMLRLDKDDLKSTFYRYFDDDDLLLFNYAFSSKAQCLNLRNNIAHSFYLPQEYTYSNAVVAFMAILRLAKYCPSAE